MKTDDEIIKEVLNEIAGLASDPIDDPATYFSESYDVQRDEIIERTDEEYNRYAEIARKFEFIETDDPYTIVIKYVP